MKPIKTTEALYPEIARAKREFQLLEKFCIDHARSQAKRNLPHPDEPDIKLYAGIFSDEANRIFTETSSAFLPFGLKARGRLLMQQGEAVMSGLAAEERDALRDIMEKERGYLDTPKADIAIAPFLIGCAMLLGLFFPEVGLNKDTFAQLENLGLSILIAIGIACVFHVTSAIAPKIIKKVAKTRRAKVVAGSAMLAGIFIISYGLGMLRYQNNQTIPPFFTALLSTAIWIASAGVFFFLIPSKQQIQKWWNQRSKKRSLNKAKNALATIRKKMTGQKSDTDSQLIEVTNDLARYHNLKRFCQHGLDKVYALYRTENLQMRSDKKAVPKCFSQELPPIADTEDFLNYNNSIKNEND